MNLQCRVELASAYKASPQIVRVLTEEWCARELYCAACKSPRLSPSLRNTPSVDFVCPECEQCFQLKGFKTWNQTKIVDAAYESMVRSIRGDRTPNLLVLHYSPDWLVKNLMLIPRAFFTESVIEKRPPLSAGARRAGWVGCNILLGRIPRDGKIAMVSSGIPVAEEEVRREFSRVKGLADVPPAVRGWTLDVLEAIRKLRKSRFSLKDVYQHELELAGLHPRNRNIRPKIRQQLQILRDLGLIEFSSPGNYFRRV